MLQRTRLTKPRAASRRTTRLMNSCGGAWVRCRSRVAHHERGVRRARRRHRPYRLSRSHLSMGSTRPGYSTRRSATSLSVDRVRQTTLRAGVGTAGDARRRTHDGDVRPSGPRDGRSALLSDDTPREQPSRFRVMPGWAAYSHGHTKICDDQNPTTERSFRSRLGSANSWPHAGQVTPSRFPATQFPSL